MKKEASEHEKQKSAKGIKLRNNIIVHTILAILAAIWMFPVLWVILTSFRGEKGSYVSSFFPKTYTLDNYIKLFTDTTLLNFPQMFLNTLIIAIFSCLLSSFFVLSASFCLSRLRFKLRQALHEHGHDPGAVPRLHVDGGRLLHPQGHRPDRRQQRAHRADPVLLRRRGAGLPDHQGLL